MTSCSRALLSLPLATSCTEARYGLCVNSFSVCVYRGVFLRFSTNELYQTLAVLATQGGSVNGFTLDPSLGDFILTHPNITMKKKGVIYSINEGNSIYWDAATKKVLRLRCVMFGALHLVFIFFFVLVR